MNKKLQLLKTGPHDSKKTKFDLSPKIWKMGDTVKIHHDVYLLKDEDHEGSSEKKKTLFKIDHLILQENGIHRFVQPICFGVGRMVMMKLQIQSQQEGLRG